MACQQVAAGQQDAQPEIQTIHHTLSLFQCLRIAWEESCLENYRVEMGRKAWATQEY